MYGEITHEDILLTLVKKVNQSSRDIFNGQDYSRRVLEKSLYFFNQNFRNIRPDFYTFDFRWGNYGPYSCEIHYILQHLVHCKCITETCFLHTTEAYPRLTYMRQDSYFETLELPDDLNSSLDRIVEFISDKSSRELELLASVHFWAKYQQSESNNYTIDFIFENIDALKPSTGFTKLDIQDAIKTLEEEKYLKSESSDLTTTLPLQSS